MAKIKMLNPVFNSITGAIKKVDRTKVDLGGLQVRINRLMHLSASTKMTRGGSHARHKRAIVYCECDQIYRFLDWDCLEKLAEFWHWQGTQEDHRLSMYQYFMKLCLSGRMCTFFEYAGCFSVEIHVTPLHDYLRVDAIMSKNIYPLPGTLYNNDVIVDTRPTTTNEARFIVEWDEVLKGSPNVFVADICGVVSPPYVFYYGDETIGTTEIVYVVEIEKEVSKMKTQNDYQVLQAEEEKTETGLTTVYTVEIE